MRHLNGHFQYTRIAVAGLGLLTLAACGATTIEEQNSLEYRPVMPMVTPQVQQGFATGAIYNPSQAGLFATDRRANKVGDILTVSFSERFQATKSQNAANGKASTFDMSLPGVLGLDQLEDSLSTGATSSFTGSGSAAQSNSLTGQMSVTVARVYDGGNLEILGQKKLTLNNGDEYIRVRGIVRPEDISSNNVVLSDRIANAEIKYIGAGDTADSAKAGWLTRTLTTISPY